jgi:hypothetical protein
MEKAGHYRTLDTLGLLLKRGKIDRAAHDAGQRFAEDFVDAHLGGAQAIDYAAVRSGNSFSGESMTERVAYALRHVHKALDVVGGIGSSNGRVLWEVIGLEIPVTQVAKNMGKDYREVFGILISTLEFLSRHYGFSDTPLQ